MKTSDESYRLKNNIKRFVSCVSALALLLCCSCGKSFTSETGENGGQRGSGNIPSYELNDDKEVEITPTNSDPEGSEEKLPVTETTSAPAVTTTTAAETETPSETTVTETEIAETETTETSTVTEETVPETTAETTTKNVTQAKKTTVKTTQAKTTAKKTTAVKTTAATTKKPATTKATTKATTAKKTAPKTTAAKTTAKPKQTTAKATAAAKVTTKHTFVQKQPEHGADYIIDGSKNGRDSGKAEKVAVLVNKHRKELGLGELKYNKDLEKAAMARAEELVVKFSHDRPDGSSCFSIVSEYAKTTGLLGENIACMGAVASSDYLYSMWYNSEGHYKNMINEGFNSCGVGVYYKDGSTYAVLILAKC